MIVLITGSNGTGKELVARGLHELSNRVRMPFIEVNCAAIPSELIDVSISKHNGNDIYFFSLHKELEVMDYVYNYNNMFNVKYNIDYHVSMVEFQDKTKGLRLGYTPGVIRHHYHGTKQNRQYTERWKILMKHSFSPMKHLTYDDKGIIIPSKDFSEEFKKDIMNYFKERKEDD